MREFEVTYKRDVNAKIKSFRVRAMNEDIARSEAVRMLKMSGSKSPEILKVRELATAK